MRPPFFTGNKCEQTIEKVILENLVGRDLLGIMANMLHTIQHLLSSVAFILKKKSS